MQSLRNHGKWMPKYIAAGEPEHLVKAATINAVLGLHEDPDPTVGSEEARPAGAGLRPPLKRYVQFSRIPLSRRRPRVMRTDGRNQTDKVDQAQLAVERGV